jgi:hypothetical protein
MRGGGIWSDLVVTRNGIQLVIPRIQLNASGLPYKTTQRLLTAFAKGDMAAKTGLLKIGVTITESGLS